ncbi:uncharacterized protein METZ01_LOCUS500804, partial [marine metagenome]
LSSGSRRWAARTLACTDAPSTRYRSSCLRWAPCRATYSSASAPPANRCRWCTRAPMRRTSSRACAPASPPPPPPPSICSQRR